MYDEKRCFRLDTLLEQTSRFDSRKRKHYKIDVLEKCKQRLCRFNELNEDEMSKLLLLLEYTVQAALVEDDVTFRHRFRLLQGHSIRYFGICPEGDLRCKNVMKGVSVGIVLGVVLGAFTGNIGLGIPIGVGWGFLVGFVMAHYEIKNAKQEDRIL